MLHGNDNADWWYRGWLFEPHSSGSDRLRRGKSSYRLQGLFGKVH